MNFALMFYAKQKQHVFASLSLDWFWFR